MRPPISPWDLVIKCHIKVCGCVVGISNSMKNLDRWMGLKIISSRIQELRCKSYKRSKQIHPFSLKDHINPPNYDVHNCT